MTVILQPKFHFLSLLILTATMMATTSFSNDRFSDKEVAQILENIQNKIDRNELVLSCKSEISGALRKSTLVKMIYSNDRQSLKLETDDSANVLLLSLTDAQQQNEIHQLSYGQSGFTVQNNTCEQEHKRKVRLYFSYIEQKGSGILGSNSPLARLEMEKTTRELSTSSLCSQTQLASCACTNNDYIARETTIIECGVYWNPFNKVSDSLKSESLEKIFNSLSKTNEDEQYSRDGHNFAINKYQILNSKDRTLNASLFWNSIPLLTGESTLNSLSTLLNPEIKPTPEMISSVLLLNADKNHQSVEDALRTIQSNPQLVFYFFDAHSSIADHTLYGWILMDKSTGEILVARRTISHLFESEPTKNKSSSAEKDQKTFSLNSNSEPVTQPRDEMSACPGASIKFLPLSQQPQAIGSMSACFFKNNPNNQSVNRSGPIFWDHVLNSFLKGTELSINTEFESPGVCYELDGIPHHTQTTELGESKRAPYYIVKRGNKVALYSHQVLTRTNHGVWPNSQMACQEKENIYRDGSEATFSWSKKEFLGTEALTFEAHQNQCFTHYTGAIHHGTHGFARFFLRQTPFGIVMVWPRPTISLTRLDGLSTLCIFPKPALKAIK